jgi:type III pantothenate kinase
MINWHQADVAESTKSSDTSGWLALMIGNSRLHWAYFKDDVLLKSWDSQHFDNTVNNLDFLWESELFTQEIVENKPQITRDKKREENSPIREYLPADNVFICLASVVPEQTNLWCNYVNKRIISLKDIPLKNLYQTMGIDRALALWGAGITFGFPCLVIDGGTALTFTGVNQQRELIGGAILPGLRLQIQSLAQKTAALPEVHLSSTLPLRWAINTSEAIASGIVYTLMAGVKDFIINWLSQFPDSKIVLTGGDQYLLGNYLQSSGWEMAQQIIYDRDLIFRGMQSVISNQ